MHTPKGTPGPRHNLHDTRYEEPFGVVLEHDQDEEEFSNVARQHSARRCLVPSTPSESTEGWNGGGGGPLSHHFNGEPKRFGSALVVGVEAADEQQQKRDEIK